MALPPLPTLTRPLPHPGPTAPLPDQPLPRISIGGDDAATQARKLRAQGITPPPTPQQQRQAERRQQRAEKTATRQRRIAALEKIAEIASGNEELALLPAPQAQPKGLPAPRTAPLVPNAQPLPQAPRQIGGQGAPPPTALPPAPRAAPPTRPLAHVSPATVPLAPGKPPRKPSMHGAGRIKIGRTRPAVPPDAGASPRLIVHTDQYGGKTYLDPDEPVPPDLPPEQVSKAGQHIGAAAAELPPLVKPAPAAKAAPDAPTASPEPPALRGVSLPTRRSLDALAGLSNAERKRLRKGLKRYQLSIGRLALDRLSEITEVERQAHARQAPEDRP